MPDLEIHQQLDEALFHKRFKRIHNLKDSPVKILGKKHRILFHDSLSNLLMAAIAGEGDIWEVFLAAQMHDALDRGGVAALLFPSFLKKLQPEPAPDYGKMYEAMAKRLEKATQKIKP